MSENASTISRITVGGTTYELKSNIAPKIVTWGELYNLKNREELSPGLKYRITDYKATVKKDNSVGLSTVNNGSFDIIIEALTTGVLSENAMACTSDDYSITKINAWEIKYCIDNDTARFAWADDSEDGKGVIYWMKDEYGNSAHYDFKGIKFDDYFTFGNTTTDYSSSPTDTCKGNTIGRCFNNGLPEKIHIGKGSINNRIGDNCSNIKLGENNLNNIIGNSCSNIELDLVNSRIGDNCSNIGSKDNLKIKNLSISENNVNEIILFTDSSNEINNIKVLGSPNIKSSTPIQINLNNTSEDITTLVEIREDYDNYYKISTISIIETLEKVWENTSSINENTEDINSLSNLVGTNPDTSKYTSLGSAIQDIDSRIGSGFTEFPISSAIENLQKYNFNTFEVNYSENNITVNAEGDSISRGFTLDPASTDKAGVMSAEDKTKLDFLSGGIQSTTYENLKTLRDESKLSQGMKYRIANYNTTTSQTEISRSAGHQFDIIVEALTENTLSEDAKVCLHAEDEYFKDCNLEAWEIKYCLDNDTTRFAWADEESGKGVIYYMKDERNNECPYDFKNILFKTNKYESDTTSDNCYYTFSYVNTENNNELRDYSVMSETKQVCLGNVIEETVSIKKTLSENIFKISYLEDNICSYNLLKKECKRNLFRNNTSFNTIEHSSKNNIFGDGFKFNTLGISSHENKFLDGIEMCHFGQLGFSNNIIGNNCTMLNFTDNYCQYNTIGNDCTMLNFTGNRHYYNSIGNNCSYITLGPNSGYINIPKNHKKINIGYNCNRISFKDNVVEKDIYRQNISIAESIFVYKDGELEEYEIDGHINKNYILYIDKDSNGNIISYENIPTRVSDLETRLDSIIGSAPENLDTIYEIADWINNGSDGAAAMLNQINLLNSQVAALSSGLKLNTTVVPSTIYRNTNNTIKVTLELKNNSGNVEILEDTKYSAKIGDNTQVENNVNDSKFIFTFDNISTNDANIDILTTATYNSMELKSSAKITACFPTYVGVGASYEEVYGKDNCKKLNTTSRNTYDYTTTEDEQYFFLIVPSEGTTKPTSTDSFSMNGFGFAVEEDSTSISNYVIYKSSVAYAAGTNLIIKVS